MDDDSSCASVHMVYLGRLAKRFWGGIRRFDTICGNRSLRKLVGGRTVLHVFMWLDPFVVVEDA